MNHELLKKIIYEQHEVIKNAKLIKRDIELEDNLNYVLVGLRRAGKTSILYSRVQDLIKSGIDWNQIIYINFDDERLINFNLDDFSDILQVSEELSEKKHYYYFDEIQNINNWEKFALRIANQGYKVDITGSNAKMISKEIEAVLGGRYISKEVLPFSFNEYLKANDISFNSYTNKEIANINNLLNQYFNFGGLPLTFQIKDKREYISSVFQKVLLGDIIVHNNIRNKNGVLLLIQKIAESITTSISYTKLQNMITGIGYKISKDIVIDYCVFCKDSFLLFSINNYYSSFIDKNSNPKYYFRDNGLLNLFLNDRKGVLLENIVAISLYRKYKELFYLNGNKVDIDFYIPNKKAIQVSYSIKDVETKKRETKNLIEFAMSKKEKIELIIVTYEEEEIIKDKGFEIKVIPLKKFLLS